MKTYNTAKQAYEYQYKWKSGSIFKADAEKIVKEIETLTLDNLSTNDAREAYVKMARNKKTEAHKTLTWDDTKAAEKCRLTEAGEVFRSIVEIRIDIKEPENSPIEYRYIEVVPSADDGKTHTYAQTVDIMREPGQKEFLYTETRKRIIEAEKKLEILYSLEHEARIKVKIQKSKKHLEQARELIFAD